MHTGYLTLGIFLAAILNYLIGSKFGWALDVCGWRIAGPLAGVGAPRRSPSRSAGKRKKSRSYVADLAAVRNPIFQCTAPSHDPKHLVYAGLDLRPSGPAPRVRPRGGDGARGGPPGESGHKLRNSRSTATMLVAFATILGCLAMPRLAEKLGRAALSHFILP